MGSAVTWALLLVGLSACAPAPSGDAYGRALAAPDFDTAWALCASAGANRADCEQASAKRFAQFDACARIEAGVWQDECRFSEAEHLARQGDRAGALGACHTSRYSVNCEQHVLDSLAMQLRGSSATEVAAAFVALKGSVKGKNSELDFWRSWHRVRAQAGLPLDADACTVKKCRTAALLQVRKDVEDRVWRDGCGTAPPVFPGGSERVAGWSAEAWQARCCLAGTRCGDIELADQTE
jgi:hypothetical protein